MFYVSKNSIIKPSDTSVRQSNLDSDYLKDLTIDGLKKEGFRFVLWFFS